MYKEVYKTLQLTHKKYIKEQILQNWTKWTYLYSIPVWFSHIIELKNVNLCMVWLL